MRDINYPLSAIGVVLLVVGVSFWLAQRRHPHFDMFDLIMENGRVSRIAVAFMLVLLVTTGVIINMALENTLTEGFFGLYIGAWVAPLVARVVFNRQEPPSTTTFTSTTEKTTVVAPPETKP